MAAEAPTKRKLTPEEQAIADAATEQANAGLAEAEARVELAKTKAELASVLPKPMNAPDTDVIGRELDWSDPSKAREQQREAHAIRQARVEEDVFRVTRGLEPKYAAE